MIISPAINCQTIEGTPNNDVEAFNIRVNKMTDKPRLALIISGLFHEDSRSLPERAILPPTITGSRVNVQGAAIVNTPARNEIIRSVIYL